MSISQTEKAVEQEQISSNEQVLPTTVVKGIILSFIFQLRKFGPANWSLVLKSSDFFLVYLGCSESKKS
jgi:hypothetical protein